ncbi:MAG: NAD-dependent epimerase/dehydratase family protein, partial [Fusobacteriaceae bacterium]|nr:NAD-dependent epimerase/dehydratase family protein [Fusobacteriaceae bacterium]
REKYFEINTELTRRMAGEAKENGVKHFVFYSTVAVYGTHGSIDKELVLNKNSKVNPNTPYGESKWRAEEMLRKLENENFKVSILRPPMVYGENCPGNMKILENVVKIFPILPFGNNKNKRTLVHINKLLEETKKIIDEEIKGINIPRDDKDVSIREIVENIAKKYNKKVFLFKMPEFLILLFKKIKAREIESIYGDLRFE